MTWLKSHVQKRKVQKLQIAAPALVNRSRGVVDGWSVDELNANRFRIRAVDPLDGRNSYTVATKGNRLDTHANLDLSRLKTDRPELYAKLEEFFKNLVPSAETLAGHEDVYAKAEQLRREGMLPREALYVATKAAGRKKAAYEFLENAPIDNDDFYGDLAYSRGQKLTGEQEWQRGLVHFREYELDACRTGRVTSWQFGVQLLWAGCFGTDMAKEQVVPVISWIIDHSPTVDPDALTAVLGSYYNGEYDPHRHAGLLNALDMVGGTAETEPQDLGDFA